jgi:hypothetical protein
MTEVFLNDPKVDPPFQQMRGIGVAQRMHMCPFGNTTAQECSSERTL